MRRGEIWMVNLDLEHGGGADRCRPAVIVSNDRANAAATRLGSGIVSVVPLTGQVNTIYPFQVYLAGGASGLPIDTKAHAEQIRSVSVGRLAFKTGELQPAQLTRLDEALRLHLQV